eukprot:scaffold3551_cov408-Prasinococcus_capsulatus_cf.AAC.9
MGACAHCCPLARWHARMHARACASMPMPRPTPAPTPGWMHDRRGGEVGRRRRGGAGEARARARDRERASEPGAEALRGTAPPLPAPMLDRPLQARRGPGRRGRDGSAASPRGASSGPGSAAAVPRGGRWRRLVPGARSGRRSGRGEHTHTLAGAAPDTTVRKCTRAIPWC